MADGYLVDDADIKKIAEFVKSGDKELADNIKALQYIIDNSNRLNYTGQVITNSNSVVGDIKNVIINGNTRYKKTDGSYTDTWESGVSIASVSEAEKNSDGKYPIIIKSVNGIKNLIEKSNILEGNYYDENNKIQPNSNFNTLKQPINVESNKTYYIVNKNNSLTNVTYILYFDINNNIIKCEYDKSSINIPSNCSKVRFSCANMNNLCFSLKNIFSEYKEDKRTILLENPLRKTPQITDVLDLDKKQVTRNCGVLTINGSEDWASNNKFFYTSSNYFNKLEQTRGNKCISNYNYVDYKDLDDQTKYGVTIAQNYRICLENMNPSNHSVEELKTWLVSNPITVVYQLATPTTERIEILPTDNPLQSYNNTTTLTLNNTIKGNISADIPTNVNAIIVNQASEIAKLQDSLLETQSALIETQYNSLT